MAERLYGDLFTADSYDASHVVLDAIQSKISDDMNVELASHIRIYGDQDDLIPNGTY